MLASFVRERRAGPGAREFLERLRQKPPERRREMLRDYVRTQVVKVLGLGDSRRLDLTRPLHELGFDSLMTIELTRSLSAATGCPLPATLVYDYPTAEGIADYLAKQVAGLAVDAPVDPESELERKAVAESAATLEGLSEDQIAVLLANEIAALKQRRSE